MADAVDAHEAAQAPPRSKASGPPSMPAVSIDDTPTEPATTPRCQKFQSSVGFKNFNFLHWNMAQGRNLRGSRQGTSSMMAL